MRRRARRADAGVMVLFVAAVVAALPAPAIRLVPAVAHPGGQVAIVGTGWQAGAPVELLAGPPRSEADRFGTAHADARGAFRKLTRLSKQAVPGSYVFVACQRQCRSKATARLRIVGRTTQARTTFIGFRTPSGNIGCGYWKFPGETAGLRCDIASGLRPLPKPKAPCVEGVWGEAVSMAPTGRAGAGCISDTMRDPRYRILAYGRTWSYGGFTCTSRVEGLTCRNREGHGWFLSRERSRIF